MIGLAPAGTMPPATAQLGVERVQDVGVYLADLEVGEERRDVVAHIAAVERECVRRAVELVEVALEKLVDGRVGPRVTSLSHRIDQPVARGLGLPFRVGSGRDDLDQVMPPLRDRVDSGVHADAQRAARQLVDAAALAS
jgi:hypothetical protein